MDANLPIGRIAAGVPPVALVADESAATASHLRRILRMLGVVRVLEARDGAEALSAMADAKPSLVVLDWRLPVVPASEILACIRDAARSHAPDMPVVVTMSEPTRSVVEAALAGRASAVVAKPFSSRALRLRLEAALATGRADR